MDYPTLKTNTGWEIYPLFAKALSVNYVSEEISKKLIEISGEVEWLEDDQDSGSYGAVSSKKNVLSIDQDLHDKMKQICLEYVVNTLGYNCDIQFTTSWFARTEHNGQCEIHTHNNSWFSGVLYFGDYDPNTSAIRFYKGDHDCVFAPTINYNFFNSYNWDMYPLSNMLILFPSDLRHKVLKNKSNNTRYALAFNIMPKGDIGISDSAFQY